VDDRERYSARHGGGEPPSLAETGIHALAHPSRPEYTC
jgi:hypothetical protein